MKQQSVFSAAPIALLLALGLFLLSAGCTLQQQKSDAKANPEAQKTPETPPQPDGAHAPKVATMVVTSTAFADGQPIPPKHTGDGEDVSPPLVWSTVPAGTKELALICDDPDAPRKEPWVHWVIYKIPADAKGLPQGVPKDERLAEPAGAVQGKNSWPDGQNIGYRGPLPPKGKPHRYFFKLYALDRGLPDKPGMTKQQVLAAISGHVIGQGQLMGTYQR
jgi:Raf kinase inhibitor-like YbhB/YbcL family protein